MAIAPGMKDLTHDIASSHRERKRKLSEIQRGAGEVKGEVRQMITGFARSRQDTNRRLRQDLARDKSRRKTEAAGILEEVQTLLKSFEASRKENSARLRTELTEGAAERRAEVKKTLGDARELIRSFRVSRRNSSAGLRRDLSQSVADTKAEAEKLRGNARRLVKDSRTARQKVGGQLRKDLARSRSDRQTDVKQMLGGFDKARRNVRTDLREARAAWQGLSSTGQEYKYKARNLPLTAAPVARAEIPGLETKLLTAVNAHPEGITLQEVAERLGVAPIMLGKASKSLLDKGQFRKEGKIYFPVDGKKEAAQGTHFRSPLR
jgi:hypothetical protein